MDKIMMIRLGNYYFDPKEIGLVHSYDECTGKISFRRVYPDGEISVCIVDDVSPNQVENLVRIDPPRLTPRVYKNKPAPLPKLKLSHEEICMMDYVPSCTPENLIYDRSYDHGMEIADIRYRNSRIAQLREDYNRRIHYCIKCSDYAAADSLARQRDHYTELLLKGLM